MHTTGIVVSAPMAALDQPVAAWMSDVDGRDARQRDAQVQGDQRRGR